MLELDARLENADWTKQSADEPIGGHPTWEQWYLSLSPEQRRALPAAYLPREDVLTAAGWEEAKHPRRPEGTEKGGEFAPKKGAFMPQGQTSTPFGDFGGEAVVAHDEPDSEMDKEIIDGFERLRREGKISKGDAYYSVTSPYRRTAGVMAQARVMYRASGSLESVARALDSAAQWGTGWDYAYDEWDAMHQLTGAALPKRLAKDIEAATLPEGQRPGWNQRAPLSATDLKAYEARRAWFQNQFRAAYGEDGVEVFRGVSGKVPSRQWLAGTESYQEDVTRRVAEAGAKPFQPGESYEEASKRDQAQNEAMQSAASAPIEGAVWPLSSWTESRGVAGEFAYGPKWRKSGVVLRTQIRPEDVWMIPVLGGQGVIRYTDVSGEYVVATPTGKREAQLVGYQR